MMDITSKTIRDRILELRRVAARELVPNPKNWRRHPARQAAALRGVLQEIGYADALLARILPDGRLMLIDGHLRAETTPDQLVPVLVLDVDETESHKLLATLDPLAAMAETDKLAFKDLAGFVMTDSAELRELLDGTAGIARETEQDAIPALPVTPVARLGQIWQLGKHKLLCGDSTRPQDVSRLDGRRTGRAVSDRPALRGRLHRWFASGDQGESRQGEPQQRLVGPVPRSGTISGHREQLRARPRVLSQIHHGRDRTRDRAERSLVLLARVSAGKRCSRRSGTRSALSCTSKSSG